MHGLIPHVMPKRCDAEVSSRYDSDVTELIKFVDKQNEKDLGYKIIKYGLLSNVFLFLYLLLRYITEIVDKEL